MYKDLNILLSFSGQITPLTHKTNLRIILGPKLEKFKNIKARKQLGILIKKKCVLDRSKSNEEQNKKCCIDCQKNNLNAPSYLEYTKILNLDETLALYCS